MPGKSPGSMKDEIAINGDIFSADLSQQILVSRFAPYTYGG